MQACVLQLPSLVSLFATACTAAPPDCFHGISREAGAGVGCYSTPGIFRPEIEPNSLVSPALAGELFTTWEEHKYAIYLNFQTWHKVFKIWWVDMHRENEIEKMFMAKIHIHFRNIAASKEGREEEIA